MNAKTVEQLGKAIKNCEDIIKYSTVNEDRTAVVVNNMDEFGIPTQQCHKLLQHIKDFFLTEQSQLVEQLKKELSS